MSAEEHLIGSPARQAGPQGEAHAYFVGRREFETTEVYEVTNTHIERLRSRHRFGDPTLDWHGTEAARMELSQLLISRVTKRRPSRDLQTRFALYVLERLPDGGFVLDARDLSRWLRVAGEAEDPVSARSERRLRRRRRRGAGSGDSSSTAQMTERPRELRSRHYLAVIAAEIRRLRHQLRSPAAPQTHHHRIDRNTAGYASPGNRAVAQAQAIRAPLADPLTVRTRAPERSLRW